jgi:D-lactate dehydrogenase
VILTQEQFDLPRKLKRIVGSDNVLDGSTLDTITSGFLKGARIGEGSALCIVTPRHLHDVEAAVEAILDADCVVIPQGQNTGLTGGSVPHMKKDTRPVVILSMKYLDSIFPIDDGDRVVCFAGVGLASVSSKS